MFIAKRKFVNDYCTWIFDVVSKIEARTSIEGYDEIRRRIYGYFTELLLNVYVLKNNLKCDTRFYVAHVIEEKKKENPIRHLLKKNKWLVRTVKALRKKLSGGVMRETDDFFITFTEFWKWQELDLIVTFIPKHKNNFDCDILNKTLNSIHENVKQIEKSTERKATAFSSG